MRNKAVRAISLFFALLISLSGVFVIGAFAEEDVMPQVQQEELKPEISISASSMELVKGKKMKLEAELINCPEGTTLKWASSEKGVAVVEQNGTVKGLKVGRTIITATAVVNGEEVVGAYAIHVTTRKNIIKSLLVSKQVLSYKYSYTDDYYYTNDKKCWQSNFGFNKLYDIVAPYVLMEYDYVRVHFTYEGKDWMIQLWKGQYGMLFYGCEMGVYTKEHSDKEDKLLTTYACAKQEDWLKMEMTMYHDRMMNGNYVREFTRDYGDYWWCTGFKDGHLAIEEPAAELRMVSHITFKTEEMAQLFAEGIKECNFEQRDGSSTEDVGLDQFCVDGKDVYFKWQNINEAENTMPIKMTAGALFFLNIFAVILSIFALFGMAGLFIIIL